MGAKEILKQEVRFKLKQFYKDFCNYIDNSHEIHDYNKVYNLFKTTDSVLDIVAGFGPQIQAVLDNTGNLKVKTAPPDQQQPELQEAVSYFDRTIENINENS